MLGDRTERPLLLPLSAGDAAAFWISTLLLLPRPRRPVHFLSRGEGEALDREGEEQDDDEDGEREDGVHPLLGSTSRGPQLSRLRELDLRPREGWSVEGV